MVLLLSDRYLVRGRLPAHALLATGAVHQHLVRAGLRCQCNLLIETATARDPHHFACLIGFGATAVYPYMAYQVLFEMMRKGKTAMQFEERVELGYGALAGEPSAPTTVSAERIVLSEGTVVCGTLWARRTGETRAATAT